MTMSFYGLMTPQHALPAASLVSGGCHSDTCYYDIYYFNTILPTVLLLTPTLITPQRYRLIPYFTPDENRGASGWLMRMRQDISSYLMAIIGLKGSHNLI